ncbi:Piso0_002251 [Millerozyma farinosa CBS 7064]|uniref:Piso0_002251 protein n=1 Tax=Pichia sorbitophila (strain ATCC MYA-4447 / BCRC 22081 / CBS 7064 / NBRC 10061 / NRRL Y-12695) TaxID=559304 RepID=G8YEJ1_PICSO|nr:Piso0_002251 [Millerozyma farinosa CBS 7064]
MALTKDLLTWCDDLHQVKGNISQLQATLNHVLNKAPSIEEYKQISTYLEEAGNRDSKSIVDKTRNFLMTSQLKVAVRMKFLYEQGMLPFLLALSQINFKSSKADKFVGYLIDYTPPKDIGTTLSKALKQRINSHKKVDVSTYPPTLPPIGNEHLLRVVLTDKSFRQPSDFLESVDAADFSRSHNAKLGLRGRCLLELLLTELLDSNVPSIHEDDLYYLRNKLLSPLVLTKLALGYNLTDNFQHHCSNEISAKDKMKILSNVFLAYVGGLAVDGYSMEEIKLWVKGLFDPIFQDISASYQPLKPFSKIALIELEFLFKQVTSLYAVSPEHTEINFESLETNPFVVKLVVDGQTLGIGTSSSSVEEAKEKAATEALMSKEKVDELLKTLIKSYQTRSSDASSSQSSDDDDDVPYSPSYDDYEPPESNTNSTSESTIPNKPQPYGIPPPLSAAPVHNLAFNPIDSGPVDTNAKNHLYAILGSNHLTPMYQYNKVGHEFHVTISVNSIVIGSSHDTNKKIASQKAAMNALANTSIWTQLGILPTQK